MITVSKKLIIGFLGAIVVLFGIIMALRLRVQPAIAPSITDSVQGQETALDTADTLPDGSKTAVSALKLFLSENLGVNESAIEITGVAAKDWPDACLGLDRAGHLCAQVVTPGYEVSVKINNNELKYRLNMDGSVIRQDSGGNANFLKG